jgi:hypothetical protein
MRYLWLVFFAFALSVPATAQWVYENDGLNGPSNIFQQGLLRDRQVSAANTALTVVYDLGNLNQVLDISAGTATVGVAGSSDNVNFLTLDSLAAAATTVKNYNNTTVGAGIGLSPLAFRWVKISIGSCGASNTSTLTVAGK